MKSSLLFFALLIAGSLPAHAADATLSWGAPQANTDGTTPAKVGGYNVYSASTDAALSALPNTSHGGRPLSVGNVLNTTFRNLTPGTYVYAVTAWYCATATDCTESAQSAHASTTVGPAMITTTPGAPLGVKIAVTVSAPQ